MLKHELLKIHGLIFYFEKNKIIEVTRLLTKNIIFNKKLQKLKV